MLAEIKETADFLKQRGIDNAESGIILGTGLGKFINHIEIETQIEYSGIPNFPVSTVEFHKGNLLFGKVGKTQVIAMQGRFHFYEGYSFNEIVFPIRVMKMLGVKNLFLSNAAGGINPDYKKGDLVLIDDHINLLPGNPLIGKNHDSLGSRFPDMSQPYSLELQQELKMAGLKKNIVLKKGVYATVTGPMLETRAEYRMLRTLGADMVGMSTVPEVIAANHLSLPCAAISVITDECDPDNLKPINIEEIIEVAGKADAKLSKILAETIAVEKKDMSHARQFSPAK